MKQWYQVDALVSALATGTPEEEQRWWDAGADEGAFDFMHPDLSNGCAPLRFLHEQIGTCPLFSFIVISPLCAHS